MGKLVDCDLLVNRDLNQDYEIVGDPLSGGQGRNTVFKVRLLGMTASTEGNGGGADAAGGGAGAARELRVLKQVLSIHLKQLMNEVLIPHKLALLLPFHSYTTP